MTTFTTGQPVWAELFTTGSEQARDFYSGLLGWGATEPNEQFGGYTNFTLGEGWIAGLMENTMDPSIPNAWTVYLHTDDIQALAGRARDAGAMVIVEPAPVGELGWFAQFIDPSGAAVGAWQPGAHAGFTTLQGPGAPYWFELHAVTGFAETVAFYRSVFGLEDVVQSDTDEFRYSTLTTEGTEVAGVMDASAWGPQACNAWNIYWRVSDLDASVAAAQAAGATLTAGPDDTPYGHLAELRDPNGAFFKLATPPAGR